MKIVVGSQNPVKLEAAREASLKYFEKVEVTGLDANSGVSCQPLGEETFEGARNRALFCRDLSQGEDLTGDFFAGIEGGIIRMHSRWFAFGATCIIDCKGREGYGVSPMFLLPPDFEKELLAGVELGILMDRLTGESNVKQKEGAIGFFSNGVINRKDLYVPGLIIAFVPFLHKDLFFN